MLVTVFCQITAEIGSQLMRLYPVEAHPLRLYAETRACILIWKIGRSYPVHLFELRKIRIRFI